MKTPVILFAGAAALALSACGGADEPAEETDVTLIEDDGPAPSVTETAVVEDADPDSVTVSEDGVRVDPDSDGTRVEADSGDDSASMTVSD